MRLINKIAKILQPQIFSGLEAPLESMIDVLIPIAEGCGSTSWVLAQYIMHNYMIARWPEQAQREVWDVNPDALVSGILIPRLGQGNSVNDGIVISGHWPWVTGISSADWCILSAMVHKDDKEVECYFLIPTSEVRVIDTWRAIGLKGTGSHDVVVDKLFVPTYMDSKEGELERDRLFCLAVLYYLSLENLRDAHELVQLYRKALI